MNPQLQILFSVNLNHDFFKTGKLQQFNIAPNPNTESTFKQIGGKIRKTDLGFSVYYPTSNLHLLTEELLSTWEFQLQTSDPSFYNFTDLPLGSLSFLFTNSQEDAILRLTKEEPEASPIPNGITLRFSPSVPTENSEASIFTLNFSARKTIWRYFIINKNGLDGPFKIKAKGVSFSDLEENELPNGVKAQLLQSDSPIAFSQTPKLEIDLTTDEGKFIMRGLPSPPTHQLIPNKDQGFFSDMYVYI